ncbi:MAG TPA: shikimate kinase [Acidimicrobiales bacterium]|nr:shikimate kinase [Acidimicrobiales bacterium]
MTPPRILLVGMMGCGKTTTGGIVARRLGWDYRDSDADVEALTGHTVPEIFANEGEAAFRKVEAEVLATACTSELPTVISVAGGAVLSADNRKLIRECGTVAWLRVEPQRLAERVGDGAGRPLLEGDKSEVMARLLTERAPYYAEVADAVIDVGDLTPDQVADRVLDAAGIRPSEAPATPST